jgi:hypothetical protein
MKKRVTVSASALLTAVGLLIFFVVREAPAGTRFTFDAEFRGSAEGGETSTTLSALTGGSNIYNKTVFVPSPVNTLLFTISTQADSHQGVALQLLCLIDGKACAPDFGGVSADAPPGWITPHKIFNYDVDYLMPDGITLNTFGDGGGGTGDEHDNSVEHTWCIPVRPGVHTVSLNMGNSCGEPLTPTCAPGAGTVFMENINFNIDGAYLTAGNACAASLPPAPSPTPTATPTPAG